MPGVRVRARQSLSGSNLPPAKVRGPARGWEPPGYMQSRPPGSRVPGSYFLLDLPIPVIKLPALHEEHALELVEQPLLERAVQWPRRAGLEGREGTRQCRPREATDRDMVNC